MRGVHRGVGNVAVDLPQLPAELPFIPIGVCQRRTRSQRVVDIRPAKFLRLRTQLTEMIGEERDSVIFCNLGTLRENNRRSLDVIGCSRTITNHGPAIL